MRRRSCSCPIVQEIVILFNLLCCLTPKNSLQFNELKNSFMNSKAYELLLGRIIVYSRAELILKFLLILISYFLHFITKKTAKWRILKLYITKYHNIIMNSMKNGYSFWDFQRLILIVFLQINFSFDCIDNLNVKIILHNIQNTHIYIYPTLTDTDKKKYIYTNKWWQGKYDKRHQFSINYDIYWY